MSELVFFYGTLMTPFHRMAKLRLDEHLAYKGPGTIEAALFDLGIYPAAVPVTGGRVHGEVYEMLHPTIVLRVLDELEGYRPGELDQSLYTRTRYARYAGRRRDGLRVGVLLQRATWSC